MKCGICGEEGFEVMAILQNHIDEEHTEVPDIDKELEFYHCPNSNCMRKNYFCVNDPGTLDNVEFVEGEEFPVKITCECGEIIRGGI